jgi:hypothetical protein
LENKFFEEKSNAMQDDQHNREALIKAILDRNGQSEDVISLAQTLLASNQDRNKKEIE